MSRTDEVAHAFAAVAKHDRELRERILRDLEPHIKYIYRIGHSLTATNIEKVVRGEME